MELSIIKESLTNYGQNELPNFKRHESLFGTMKTYVLPVASAQSFVLV